MMPNLIVDFKELFAVAVMVKVHTLIPVPVLSVSSEQLLKERRK